ncbi:outer membrane beta-barrel protein [Maricaulis sp. CAU 1757]
MFRYALAASLSALALTAGAQAQENTITLGAGYERVDIEEFEFDTFVVRAGYDFTRFFGIEGQANVGLGEEDIAGTGGAGEVAMDYSFGLYGVFRPVQNEQGSVFLRGGYTNTQLDASVGGLSDTASENAWAVGVGGEYFFDGVNGVRADYTHLEYSDDGGSGDAFGIAYVRRIGG